METAFAWILGSILTGIFLGVFIQVFFVEKRAYSRESKIMSRIEKERRILRGKQKELENQIRIDSRRTRSNWDREKKKTRQNVLAQINQNQAQDKDILRQSRFIDSQIRELEKKNLITQKNIEKADESQKAYVERREETRNGLVQIANYSPERARELLLKSVQSECQTESNQIIQTQHEASKEKIKEESARILAHSIRNNVKEFANESVLTPVTLPDDKMKGQIIGREGRNIRAFEAATGINIIIDESPATIMLSGFDTYRKEIARLAIQNLLGNGKINPARIEEVIKEVQTKFNGELKEIGAKASKEMGFFGIHQEILKLLGKLHYLTFSGKNLLEQSKICSQFAESLCRDLQIDPAIPKRVAWLHDIGRALEKELEGDTSNLGADIARQYGESPDVVLAIRRQGNWENAPTPVILIVALVVEITTLRPGTETENLKNYLQRLPDVEKEVLENPLFTIAFAFQTVHDLRLWVKAPECEESEIPQLARELCLKIKASNPFQGICSVVLSTKISNFSYHLS